MERGAVFLLVLLSLYLVLTRPSAAPDALRASGVHQVQPPPADCCLIPANRGLYPAR